MRTTLRTSVRQALPALICVFLVGAVYSALGSFNWFYTLGSPIAPDPNTVYEGHLVDFGTSDGMTTIGETGGGNLYRFVRNDPVDYWDYFGLFFPGQGNFGPIHGGPGKDSKKCACLSLGGKWQSLADHDYRGDFDACVRAEGYGSWPGLIGAGAGAVIGGRIGGPKCGDIGSAAGAIIGGALIGISRCSTESCYDLPPSPGKARPF